MLLDNEIEQLQKKYGVTLFRPFNKNRQYDGLKVILEVTKNKLREIYDVDMFDEYVRQESERFLVYLLDYQQHYRAEWFEYYNGLLNFFHELDYLTFKENIITYRKYFNKDIVISVVFAQTEHTPYHVQHYRTATELETDLGFWLASRLLKEKKNCEDEAMPSVVTIDNFEVFYPSNKYYKILQ